MCTFPDESVTRNYKIKEMHVVNKVKDKFQNLSWICDKKYDFAPSECGSLRRPDMYCHFGDKVIIVEVDENQHKLYDSTCDNKRLCELYQDFNFLPITFIKFNPDDYYDINNKRVTSCFGYDKNGICKIKKSKETEFENRLNKLFDTINQLIDNKKEKDETKSINIIKLFFDQYNQTISINQ